MSLQLCLLETGETIIADVREAIDPESNESLGYLVTNPFSVKHIINNVVNVEEMSEETNTSPENAASLSYSVWAPLARQNTFNFHTDEEYAAYRERNPENFGDLPDQECVECSGFPEGIE